MKRLVGCLLVFIVAFSGCTEKLDEQIINDFEQAYKIVEVDKQLQQLCQNAEQYTLFIKTSSYIITISIHTEYLTGTLKYFKQYDFESERFEYQVEVTSSGIVVYDEKQTVLPLDVLFVYNDVNSNIETYRTGKRASGIKYDANKVIAKYPIVTYYNQIYEKLILSFGSEQMKNNFLEEIKSITEIKEIYLTYEYDYNQPYKIHSRTTIADAISEGGISYEIYEQCDAI